MRRITKVIFQAVKTPTNKELKQAKPILSLGPSA